MAYDMHFIHVRYNGSSGDGGGGGGDVADDGLPWPSYVLPFNAAFIP